MFFFCFVFYLFPGGSLLSKIISIVNKKKKKGLDNRLDSLKMADGADADELLERSSD
jgi:hypothetical protein